MALLLSEIQERLQKPVKRNSISRAVKHENRIRFHCESAMEPSDIVQPLTVFLDWVKTLIPKDKYNIFVSLFRFPTPVVELTKSIFTELARVFDGRNPVFNYQFTDSTYRDDWEWYRQEKLKEPSVWRQKGWRAYQTAINSFLVVDLPVIQQDRYPEPYFYFLGVENAIDYDYDDISGKLNWIIFRQGKDRVAVFDDGFYKVLRVDATMKILGVEVDNPHSLGYCPVSFFWRKELTVAQPDVKESPLSPQLGNLDWLLFFMVSKKHLDLYAPYPVYSAYAADCDFENNETGDYCDGGFLRNRNKEYKVNNLGMVERCPVCAEKRIAGVGSFVEIPIPDANGPDLRNPVQITTVDRASLDYNVEEVKRLKQEITDSIVGTGGDIQKKASVNEMQVTANFESRISILNSIREGFEHAWKFVDDTCCRLRYGEGFLGSSVSLGTEFYIYTVEDLNSQYEQAKKNGVSSAELDALADQIIETEYRNNPQQMQRMVILKHLEPYRHYTLSDLISLQSEGLIDENLLKIKINFSTFVDRFERENMNVIEFGSQLDFSKKIDIITKKFMDYAREQSIPGPGGIPKSIGQSPAGVN